MKKKPKKAKLPPLVFNGKVLTDPHPGQFKKIHEKPTEKTMSAYGAIRFTLKETAACLGMSDDTLHRFLKEDPRLRAAFDAGHSKAVSSVSNTAYKVAVSGVNPNATFRWLESNDKERWNKTHIIENKTTDNQDEMQKWAEKLLQAAKNPTKD